MTDYTDTLDNTLTYENFFCFSYQIQTDGQDKSKFNPFGTVITGALNSRFIFVLSLHT